MSRETQQPSHRSAAAALSFWLGLFALALALPPTLAFFFVPGYWLAILDTIVWVSPALALVALAAGAPKRASPRARLGMSFAAIALALLLAWWLRGHFLLRSAL
jgi:VIT1/CCC1 family predicted Fe2+/Mn2+ transporter